MKSITTLLFLSLFLPLPAQILFQVTEPASLKGIYPCQSPDAAEWGSPDLQTAGNWFSDTVLIADDGMLAGACAPLNNPLAGNFGIARRTSDCSIGLLLTNMQNAGATGVLIIDTVDGRPLSFPSDVLSQSVLIPFLVISESQGDSLLNHLLNGETVVVGMGNKTGVHSTDAGLYKNRCLWYTNAVNDDESTLIDTNFGAWVFNPGTTNLSDLQLSLDFLGNAPLLTFDSDQFDLQSGDSLFVPLQLPAANFLNSGDYSMQYRLFVPGDEDTTDNVVSLHLRIQHERSAPVLDYALFSSGSADYLLQGSSLNWGDTVSCFMVKEPVEGFIRCLNEIHLKIHVKPEQLPAFLELDYAFYSIEVVNGQPVIDPDNFVAAYSDNYDIFTSEYELVIPVTAPLTGSPSGYYGLLVYSSMGIPFQFLFTGDAYPDQRLATPNGLQAFYYRNENLPVPEFFQIEKQLTPVFEARYNNDVEGCYWSSGKLREPVFTIYPNPVSDFLIIETEVSGIRMEIRNIAGMICKELITYENQVSVNDLPSGIYTIHFTDTNGQEYRRRFVKI